MKFLLIRENFNVNYFPVSFCISSQYCLVLKNVIFESAQWLVGLIGWVSGCYLPVVSSRGKSVNIFISGLLKQPEITGGVCHFPEASTNIQTSQQHRQPLHQEAPFSFGPAGRLEIGRQSRATSGSS